ncbi:EAL domain-containing protein [Pararobbsia silviterrae]|uniref:EAL domain-containing protein n=1 Tax=Pararobbsia silviterrae TaxID=1792498 RepID=A0A494Y9C2_9BURK|nr:EAL domain-containing protein [Pararobbsia silviterrae]RKP59302.1 EAL domain-containing protein [Pararobbsia silviterrae]
MKLADLRRTMTPADRSAIRRRSLLAIPLLGFLLLGLLWIVILSRLQVEKEAAYRESSASAAILSAALEQHTIKAIHQVDQITRFIKYEFEKSPATFNLRTTVDKGVVQSDTLVQISLIDSNGKLIASTADADSKPIDLSDREHFVIHKRENDDRLYISTPVLGRVSKHWTLQITRRLNNPNGTFAGVVVVSEDPSYFTNDFYNNAAIGKDGVISVVSDNGVVLARRTGSSNPQTPGSFSAAGNYPTGRHVSGVYDDPIDGVSRIVSYRHIDGYPLGVLVGLSEAEELADFDHTRNVYLLMGIFITLAMIAFFGVSTSLISKLLGREREMIDLVEYDALTELPNRYHTLKMLREEVGQAANVGRLALLYIDLDNFKTVNDTLGHNAGDAILQLTAARLEDAVGGAGMLARIGGDEFVVVMRGDHVEEDATRIAESIERTLREPFDLQGSAFVLQASIGIALHTIADESEVDLLKKADLAMYSAKDAGKGCYAFYSPALAHRVDHLMKWEQQLRVALNEGQLFLAYQPKIDLAHRCIAGFEALVRWDHPVQGLISAGEFIPIAESTGLIVPIGDFVLESACRQLGLWQRQGYSSLTLAINISSVQFWRGDILETVGRCLREFGIAPYRLELEITETAMMEYPDLVSEKIFALKRLGVRIALDDFGTGYSSLSYLNRFAVDTLKVDKSFVQAIPHDRSVCVMVSAIIGLARSLGLTVVVEGTETEEQIAWLESVGHVEAQGFLFSRPVPASEIGAIIEKFGVCSADVT